MADATRPRRASAWQHARADTGRVLALAWPVFVGQLAVLAFSTIDTLLAARASALDLATLGVAAAVYISVFIGLMGVVMAVSPIVGQLLGAGRLNECGEQLRQAVWMAWMLSVPGGGLLLWPTPFLAVAQVGPDVEPMVRGYLGALAVALPGGLLFTAFRGFSTAIANTRVVMRLQLTGLALKAPLSTVLVFGIGTPGDALHLPALGVLGCGIATAIALWAQALLAWRAVRRDPAYARFGVQGRGLGAPDPARLRTHLRLGLPMGLSILIEVTGFTFMAIFIARLGSTAVAGHQIAANLVALMFMMPLAVAQAGSALVAQQVGAGHGARARALGWHAVGLGAGLATVLGGGVFLGREAIVRAYTHDPTVIAAATPLLSWVALFHLGDALQTVAAFVLRAWHIATAPMVIYALSLWGVGLGGGWWLAFAGGAAGPQGASGFWRMGTLGLGIASLALLAWLVLVGRRTAAHERSLTPRGPAASE